VTLAALFQINETERGAEIISLKGLGVIMLFATIHNHIGIIYKKEEFLKVFPKSFNVVCEKWNERFLMRDVKTESDLARFVAKRFSNLDILMLIVNTLELVQKILSNTLEKS